MFSVELLGQAGVVAAKIGRTLAASLEFSEDFQIVAGIGAASYLNDRSPVIGDCSKPLPLIGYKDRHGSFYIEHAQQWKRLWCAGHRNRLLIQKGQWSVTEGLLRRYICLSEISEGLGNLDCAYLVQSSELPPPMEAARRCIDRSVLRRRSKFESLFDRNVLARLDRRLQRWPVYTKRRDWPSLPYLLQDVRGDDHKND